MRITVLYLALVLIIASSCAQQEKNNNLPLSGCWHHYSKDIGYLEICFDKNKYHTYFNGDAEINSINYKIESNHIISTNNTTKIKTYYAHENDSTLFLQYKNDTIQYLPMLEKYEYKISDKPETGEEKMFDYVLMKEAALRRYEISWFQSTGDTSIIHNRYKFREDVKSGDYPPKLLKIWQMIDEAYPDSIYIPIK